MDLDTFTRQLESDGICQWPDFISPEFLVALRADFQQLQTDQAFTRAGTGQGSDHQVRDQVRLDQVHWLDRQDSTVTQALLWQKLDQLQQTFNRALFLGLRNFEGHYAAYPIGGFYKRHLDCFQHDQSRILSLILYLNQDWKTADGGELRIYHQDTFTDIAPIGGNLVCFLSAESEHEVLLCQKDRLSFTGWFK